AAVWGGTSCWAAEPVPATPLTPSAASSTPRAAPAAGRASVAPAAASSGAGAPRWRPVPSDGVPADADGTSLLSGLTVSVPFADGDAGADGEAVDSPADAPDEPGVVVSPAAPGVPAVPGVLCDGEGVAEAEADGAPDGVPDSD